MEVKSLIPGCQYKLRVMLRLLTIEYVEVTFMGIEKPSGIYLFIDEEKSEVHYLCEQQVIRLITPLKQELIIGTAVHIISPLGTGFIAVKRPMNTSSKDPHGLGYWQQITPTRKRSYLVKYCLKHGIELPRELKRTIKPLKQCLPGSRVRLFSPDKGTIYIKGAYNWKTKKFTLRDADTSQYTLDMVAPELSGDRLIFTNLMHP